MLMVRSGTDIIKIAWEPILDRCLYAGVSPNPSDYVEPPYQGVEISGTNWEYFLVAK
jgi:hypothetical protein